MSVMFVKDKGLIRLKSFCKNVFVIGHGYEFAILTSGNPNVQ